MRMVERVARSLAEARFGGHIYWDQESDNWRQAHIDMARAAITAMHQPTNEMLEHAKPYMDSWSSNLAWWGAMIDAALKE